MVEPKAKSGGSAGRRQHRTGLTGGLDRSDQWTGLTSGEHRSNWWWPWTPRRSEAEDTRRDRKACVEAKQGAMLGCPFDEENLKFPTLSSRGVYRLKDIVVICHLSGT